MRDRLAAAVPTSQAEAIEMVRALEELKASSAAAQAVATNTLAEMRDEDEERRGIPARQRGKGLGAEIALARKDSPSRGSRHLGAAKALVREMPRTLAHLAAGRTSEWRAALMVQETACLPVADRSRVDEALDGDLPLLGDKQVASRARALALQLDQSHALRRAETELKKRRVSVRPAPGDMAYLTAYLPMTQAVRAYASLHATAMTLINSGHADGRSRDQITADLVLTRLTTTRGMINGAGAAEGPGGGSASTPGGPEAGAAGDATAGAAGDTSTVGEVALSIVMTDATLIGDSDQPAWIPGHGPIAATIARHHVARAARVFYRRLWTDPAHGGLVSTESRSREFTGQLRNLILLRDDVCASPYCNAPIRHIDHATPHADGGPTSLENASGLCERCNHTKQNPGWAHTRDTSGQGLTVSTPTGHAYAAAGSILPARAPKPSPPLSPDAIAAIRTRFGSRPVAPDPVFKKNASARTGHTGQGCTGKNDAGRNGASQDNAGRNGMGRRNTGHDNDDPPG